MSQEASPLVRPHEEGPGPGAGPGPGPEEAPEHAVLHVVFAQAESAFIFAVPPGCAVSQAASHVSSLQRLAQSMSAVQSASPVHAFASAQQFVSRQESQVASPLPKPHALTPPSPPPPPLLPPHAEVQVDCMQVVSDSSSLAPLGWAVMHAEMHVSSVHASPHEMSAVQSASEIHAVFCAQQLASMQVSHVASPVPRPHAPASRLPPLGSPMVGFFWPFRAIAATVLATPLGRESARVDCQWLAAVGEVFPPAVLPGAPGVSIVVVQANVSVDVMAITPKVINLMCPPRPELAPCLTPKRASDPRGHVLAQRATTSLSVRT